MDLLYPCTSIKGRECGTVQRPVDEFIYNFWQIFKNSIEAAGSLAGSPGSTRCGMEAFMYVALLSLEVAVSLSGN